MSFILGVDEVSQNLTKTEGEFLIINTATTILSKGSSVYRGWLEGTTAKKKNLITLLHWGDIGIGCSQRAWYRFTAMSKI